MAQAIHISETGRRTTDALRTYPLAYTDDEFKRLERQGRFLHDLSEDILCRAGLSRGMHVLDVGCGVGDLSLLAGSLVGSSGTVLGVDRSADSIDIAHRRAVRAKQDRVRFAIAELDSFQTDEQFDAVIGRLVLLYLPDPAATLRQLCRHLRPGGIVAFQEIVMSFARSVPEGREFNRCRDWIVTAFERAGAEIDMGSRLFSTFIEAGLTPPQMISLGRVEGGPQSQVYDYMAGAFRALLPVIERAGIATAAEVDVDTVAERLRQEAIRHQACLMPPPLIGAWARLPG